ncbi:MAG TPA: PDZ domain-containing protein [Planctomycetaceae bacterium]|nr:PDZ domain-containing protein [Planctomycetaceae bacterium]
MTSRRIGLALVLVASLCGVGPGELWAQEPPAQPEPTQSSNQHSSQIDSIYRSVNGNLFVSDNVALNFATLTYGNLLGIEVADVDAALRTQLDVAAGIGVVVTSVSEQSEAAKSGLALHDIVLKIGDQSISGPKPFHDLLANEQGKSVVFHVLRKGKPVTATVAVPKKPVYEISNQIVTFPAESNHSGQSIRWLLGRQPLYALSRAEPHYRVGLNLAEADDALRSQLRLAAGEGLVVTEVVADSPAAKAGIQRNDVLIKLDGKRLTTVDAANAQIQEIKDRTVSVAFFRAGQEMSRDVAPRLTNESSGQYELWNRFAGSVVWDRDAGSALGLSLLKSNQDGTFTDVAKDASLLYSADSVAARLSPHVSLAEQIAGLKKQLADLQKSIEQLEAVVQTAAPEKPATPPEK